MNPSAPSVVDRNKALLENAESFVYKPLEDGQELNAHVFFPEDEEGEAAAAAMRPAVVFFFSSQWDGGQVSQFAPHAMYFASRGAVSVLFEYRTATTHGTGPVEAMADVRTAIRWMRYNQEHLGIDERKIVGVGATAGAHGLAAAAMIEAFDDNEGEAQLSCVPDAMILFCPMVDLSKRGCGMDRFESPRVARRYDPSRFVRKKLPPMLIFQGTADRVVPPVSVEKFAKRMSRKKNVCQLELFEGKGNSFYNFNVDVVSYEAAISTSDQFLVEQGFFAASEDDDGSMRLVSWREQEY